MLKPSLIANCKLKTYICLMKKWVLLCLWVVVCMGAMAQNAAYTMAGKKAVAYNGAKIKTFEGVYILSPTTLAIRKGDKWALADYTGKRKTKFIFNEIKPMPQGFTIVYGLNNAMGLVDVEGNMTLTPQCYDIKVIQHKYIRLYGNNPDNPQAALADSTGKIVVPMGAQGIDIIKPRGLIAVKRNNKIGFVSLTGQQVTPNEYEDYLADNPKLGIIQVKKNGLWGFIDNSGREVMPPKYDVIITSSAPLGTLLMRKGEDWGLVDTTGTEVLPPNYWAVYMLKPNYAAVQQDSLWGVVQVDTKELIIPYQYNAIAGAKGNKLLAMQNGRWGIADFSGTTVVPFKYDKADNSAFETGLLPVRIGKQSLLVDTLGRELLGNAAKKTARLANGNVWAKTPEGWQLQNPAGTAIKTEAFDRLRWYSSDMTVAIKDGAFGLLDNNGQFIKPFEYDSISYFTATTALVYKEKKKGLVKSTGSSALPVNYYFVDAVGKGFYSICEGYYEVQKRNNFPVRVVVCKFGLIDSTGKIVLPPQYDEIDPFVGGFAPIKLNGLRGLIDSLGRTAVEPKYNRITAFQGNVAWVRVKDRWGLINKQGTELLEPQFSDDYRLLLPNTPPDLLQGYYPRFVKGYAPVCYGRRWGIVSAEGKLVAEPVYEQLDLVTNPTAKTIALVRDKKKWGTLNAEGKYSIKPKFFNIFEFTDGLARVSTTGPYGYVTETGDEAIPYNFTKAAPFKNGKAIVSLSGRYFIIDTDGRPLIE